MLNHTARPTEAAARFLDLGALVIALPLSFSLHLHLRGVQRAHFDAYWLPLLITVLAWGAAAWVYRVYDSRPHSVRDEFMRIARALVLVAFAVFALIFFAQIQWVSRLLVGVYFGVITGDLILYYIGRRFGRKIVYHKRFGRVLTEARLMRAKVWFSKWGDPLVFFGRHFVGFRAQIFLCAGVLKHSAKRVMFYDSLSAFIGVPVMVGLGYLFGHNLPAIRRYVENTHWALTGAALLVIAGAACWLAYKKWKR